VSQGHDVTDVRAPWLDHRLHAEVSIRVPSDLTVAEGHEITAEVRHQLLHHLKYLSLTVTHVDPDERSGDRFRAIGGLSHDSLPAHSHAA
jgi:divalent metal cation (Fe/Co/Zn/Cd) transporter